MGKMEKLQLTDDDLDGITLEDVKCRQCGPFCSERQPVFLEGRPIAICTRRDEGRAVVKRWKAHTI